MDEKGKSGNRNPLELMHRLNGGYKHRPTKEKDKEMIQLIRKKVQALNSKVHVTQVEEFRDWSSQIGSINPGEQQTLEILPIESFS